MVREGLTTRSLIFHCVENAAVGSAAMTSPRNVIRYRLALRVIRRRSHIRCCVTPKEKNKHRFLDGVYFLYRAAEKDIMVGNLEPVQVVILSLS